MLFTHLYYDKVPLFRLTIISPFQQVKSLGDLNLKEATNGVTEVAFNDVVKSLNSVPQPKCGTTSANV